MMFVKNNGQLESSFPPLRPRRNPFQTFLELADSIRADLEYFLWYYITNPQTTDSRNKKFILTQIK